MKKTLIFALILALLGACTVSAAEEDAVLTLGSVTLSPGERGEITLDLTSNPGLWGLLVAVSCENPAVTVEMENARNGDLFPIFRSGAQLYLEASGLENITTTGRLATVPVSVAVDAAPGTYAITLTIGEGNCINAEAEDVSYAVISGFITVTASEHSFSDLVEIVAPTCTEAGTGVRRCSHCDLEVQKEIPALGHDFGEWILEKSPTCIQEGTEVRTCGRCAAAELRQVSATDHNYKGTVVAATDTTQGYTEYTCTVCGDSYRKDFRDLPPAKKVASPVQEKAATPSIWPFAVGISGVLALAGLGIWLFQKRKKQNSAENTNI